MPTIAGWKPIMDQGGKVENAWRYDYHPTEDVFEVVVVEKEGGIYEGILFTEGSSTSLFRGKNKEDVVNSVNSWRRKISNSFEDIREKKQEKERRAGSQAVSRRGVRVGGKRMRPPSSAAEVAVRDFDKRRGHVTDTAKYFVNLFRQDWERESRRKREPSED